MLLLVHQSSNADLAAKLAKELVDVFHDATEVVLIGAESPSAVIRDPAWDDLLLDLSREGTYFHIRVSVETPQRRGHLTHSHRLSSH